MKSIRKSSIAKLRQGEIIQLSKNTMYVYQKAETVPVKLMDRVKQLSDATIHLDSIYKNAQGHKLSSDVKLIDDQRVNILRGIKMFIKAQIKIHTAEEKETAELLLKSYETHIQSLEKLGMQEKTAIVDALLNDLRTEKALQDAVVTLNMRGLFDKLAAVNQQFDTQYINRAVTKTPNTKSIEKKDTIINAYMVLYEDTVSFSRVADDSKVFTDILKEISGLYDFYSTPAKMRALYRKKDKEAAETPDGTTDML
jgi:hypothetical protein